MRTCHHHHHAKNKFITFSSLPIIAARCTKGIRRIEMRWSHVLNLSFSPKLLYKLRNAKKNLNIFCVHLIFFLLTCNLHSKNKTGNSRAYLHLFVWVMCVNKFERRKERERERLLTKLNVCKKKIKLIPQTVKR